jgi:hypothetical protein
MPQSVKFCNHEQLHRKFGLQHTVKLIRALFTCLTSLGSRRSELLINFKVTFEKICERILLLSKAPVTWGNQKAKASRTAPKRAIPCKSVQRRAEPCIHVQICPARTLPRTARGTRRIEQEVDDLEGRSAPIGAEVSGPQNRSSGECKRRAKVQKCAVLSARPPPRLPRRSARSDEEDDDFRPGSALLRGSRSSPGARSSLVCKADATSQLQTWYLQTVLNCGRMVFQWHEASRTFWRQVGRRLV